MKAVSDFVAAAMEARVVRTERVQSLWSGYGEIVRMHLDGPVPSVVVKSVTPPRASGVSHARKCRSYDVELHWYRHHAARCTARIPRLLASRKAPDAWLFVLEDLDAAGYSGRRGSIDRALGWLARFHATFLGTAPDGLWRRGTYWHLATRLEELAKTADPRIRAAAPALDAQLAAGTFRTLVHGDAKPANFCFAKDDVAAVDFQYVGGGVGVQDVAYLLSGDVAREEPYIDRYFEYLGKEAHGVDFPALEREWRALYPIAKADYERFLAGWMHR